MKLFRLGGREGWNELNAAQGVLLPVATIAGFFGFIFALLLILAVLVRSEHPVSSGAFSSALIFPVAGLVLGTCATMFTKRQVAQRGFL